VWWSGRAAAVAKTSDQTCCATWRYSPIILFQPYLAPLEHFCAQWGLMGLEAVRMMCSMEALEQVSPKCNNNLTTSFDRGASILPINRPTPKVGWRRMSFLFLRLPSCDIILPTLGSQPRTLRRSQRGSWKSQCQSHLLSRSARIWNDCRSPCLEPLHISRPDVDPVDGRVLPRRRGPNFGYLMQYLELLSMDLEKGVWKMSSDLHFSFIYLDLFLFRAFMSLKLFPAE
jgi:hypothetical protein